MRVKLQRQKHIVGALPRLPIGQRAMAAGGIYLAARQLGYLPALNVARSATSVEERNFFAYIADMNLQREQQVYIIEEHKLYKR